jgi:c-di-GMP-binding flagellar brake protein YcgR
MPQKRTRSRKERRSTVRADARLSMRVAGPRNDGDLTQVVTESQNISASGVYCHSPHYLAPLSKVDLAIVLPRLRAGRGSKDVITCEGIVVRCDAVARRGELPYELACMFCEMDPRRRQRIEEYVTWRNLQALRAATGIGRTAARAAVSARSATRAATAARSARARTARTAATRKTAKSKPAPRRRGTAR